MKKVLSLVIMICIIIVCFSGCVNKDINEGIIISKEFTPAHSEIIMMPMVVSNGKSTSTVIVPYIYYYNDKWEITIQGVANGEIVKETYRVKEEVYEKVSLGDNFKFEESMNPESKEYTKEKLDI